MTGVEGPRENQSGATSEASISPAPPQGRRRPPSFFWPLILVGSGVLLLLSNLGYVPWGSWNVLWRLWPLLLIALGIDVLIGRRTLVGAIVSGILLAMLIAGAVLIVLFAQNIPALRSAVQGSEWQTEHVEHPLDGVETASVAIDWTSLPGHLGALADSPNLIEADVSFRGDLIFDVDEQGDDVTVELDSTLYGLLPWPPSIPGLDRRAQGEWEVALSPNVQLALSLDVGSGSCAFDLGELQVGSLTVDGGSGSAELSLPAAGSFDVEIDGGSGSMSIRLPANVGARVDLDSGSGSFNPDGRFRLVAGDRRGDSVWETENYRTALNRVQLPIDQGSGSLTID
jgi:hypothetical protein